METRRTTAAQLRDAYRVTGFSPRRTITAVEGDPFARIVTLMRRAKNDLRDVRHSASHVV